MNQLARGVLAGVLATLPMTAVIAAGRWARLLWTPPPVEITARAQQQTGVGQRLPEPAFQVSWLAAHLGYGAACGLVYTLARRLLPRSPLAAGLAFGGAVWGVSYLGLMPALGLYPWPEQDSRSRTGVMIAAHGVYGMALAEAARRLSRRDARPTARPLPAGVPALRAGGRGGRWRR
ncbi:MAG: hypothetical protein HY690_20295 [Chloroflexi bacterium]|nr:hypothetical protein [Chloroflexota bacterium]